VHTTIEADSKSECGDEEMKAQKNEHKQNHHVLQKSQFQLYFNFCAAALQG
jgi:hypothetical protein